MSKFKPTSLAALMLIVTFVGIWHVVPLPIANAQDAACPSPDDLPPQLALDTWARVGSGLAHNVRVEASTKAAIVAQVPDGDIFRVVDGPTCADGYVWWQVDYAG